MPSKTVSNLFYHKLMHPSVVITLVILIVVYGATWHEESARQ